MDSPATVESQDEAFQEQTLQGVSRTFALTIPQLPDQLALVVGNAYLLCRIADTIEDDKYLAPEIKARFVERFVDVIAGREESESYAQELSPLLSDETTPSELELIEGIPSVIRITHALNFPQRSALERCVSIMASGMSEYQEERIAAGMDSLPDMSRYCYYVAGVVGEMLTELFCDYSDEIESRQDQLMQLAVSFGQGLQMTNILKDIWDDHERGACWLPRDVFSRYGFDLLSMEPGRSDQGFQQGMGYLIGVARSHLANALHYTLLIPTHETGIRRFCLWAIGMAVLTLKKINKHRDFQDGRDVKISRRSVKGTVFVTSLCAGNDRLLQKLFAVTAGSLPEVVLDDLLDVGVSEVA